VTTATRSPALPDVPAVGESVPGYEASQWYGLGAPKNTPAEIVSKLNSEINAGLADPKLKARLADLGVDPMSVTSADFCKLIADERPRAGLRRTAAPHRAKRSPTAEVFPRKQLIFLRCPSSVWGDASLDLQFYVAGFHSVTQELVSSKGRNRLYCLACIYRNIHPN
jgi:hypothetical protein